MHGGSSMFPPCVRSAPYSVVVNGITLSTPAADCGLRNVIYPQPAGISGSLIFINSRVTKKNMLFYCGHGIGHNH